MREDVLQAVRQLKSIDITETVLDHAIHDQLREPQDLARQVEGVAEARPASDDARETRLVMTTQVQVEKFKETSTLSQTFSAPSS